LYIGVLKIPMQFMKFLSLEITELMAFFRSFMDERKYVEAEWCHRSENSFVDDLV